MIPDLSKLGIRERERLVVTPGTGKLGENALILVRLKEKVQQPILTPEEAEILKDEVWIESPEHFKLYGAFVCRVSGMRFFCSVDPSHKAVIQPEEAPEPIMTNKQMIEKINKLSKEVDSEFAKIAKKDISKKPLKQFNKKLLNELIEALEAGKGII